MPVVRDAKVNKTDPAFREHTDQRGYRPQAIITECTIGAVILK